MALQNLLIGLLIFVVASLYSSVGHGGASGYIAVLTLLKLPPVEVSSAALLLNLVVSGVATYHFGKAGHFSKNLLWPFLITSIPAAFIGGYLKVPKHIYDYILFVTLTIASYRIVIENNFNKHEVIKENILIKLALGAIIGFVSGIVGVGGGIFLSPIILLLGWADTKKTAAVSGAFIFLNSFSGIVGRVVSSNFAVTGLSVVAIIAALIGGYFGANLGANKFSNVFLRRLLAIVLLIAALKLVVS